MFASLVWQGAIQGKQPAAKLDYSKLDSFYSCEVLSASGNYLFVAPLFFEPFWVSSNLVQISEENYYELIEDGENWEAVYNAMNAVLNFNKEERDE